MLRRRAVVVHRRTELDDLLDRHGTRGQAEFFLRSRGRSLAEVQARHDALTAARDAVVAALPAGWARADVERADLSRFLVAPEDVVVVVGRTASSRTSRSTCTASRSSASTRSPA